MTAPHQLDCHEVAQRLYEYLDQELTDETEQAVRIHLSDCRGCFSLFTFEQSYLRFLTARARARAAPERLRRRIFEEILFDEGGAPAE